jgi:hypothetical protein
MLSDTESGLAKVLGAMRRFVRGVKANNVEDEDEVIQLKPEMEGLREEGSNRTAQHDKPPYPLHMSYSCPENKVSPQIQIQY